MFPGFALDHLALPTGVTLRVRHYAGDGTRTPVLLLHGHPRTHATWARVAPLLGRPSARGDGGPAQKPTRFDDLC
jgi:haloacetate dehalogenase